MPGLQLLPFLSYYSHAQIWVKMTERPIFLLAFKIISIIMNWNNNLKPNKGKIYLNIILNPYFQNLGSWINENWWIRK